ncbi:MAG: D-alanyl-D-alanine carboxypeptidase family protein [Bacteroidetes bacterium]|nr:D-alanyl-D-alanine carboxypeptidase family protein [Bacteroidota bacterium]
MSAPLIKIQLPSIYMSGTTRLNLPERMAKCSPDTKKAIYSILAEVKKLGGELILSDLFRSYDMQLQSNKDYLMGKKKAFSPPPGASMHEAGRAFDMDLNAMKIPLKKFWEIASSFGVLPIISQPKTNVSEAWHFDCHGSHQLIYDYYHSGKGKNMKPYTAMAASAIVSIGVHVDQFDTKQNGAFIQSGLIRLGQTIGDIDGAVGPKSKSALSNLAINSNDLVSAAVAIENLLKQKFPMEYQIATGDVVVIP